MEAVDPRTQVLSLTRLHDDGASLPARTRNLIELYICMYMCVSSLSYWGDGRIKGRKGGGGRGRSLPGVSVEGCHEHQSYIGDTSKRYIQRSRPFRNIDLLQQQEALFPRSFASGEWPTLRKINRERFIRGDDRYVHSLSFQSIVIPASFESKILVRREARYDSMFLVHCAPR